MACNIKFCLIIAGGYFIFKETIKPEQIVAFGLVLTGNYANWMLVTLFLFFRLTLKIQENFSQFLLLLSLWYPYVLKKKDLKKKFNSKIYNIFRSCDVFNIQTKRESKSVNTLTVPQWDKHIWPRREFIKRSTRKKTLNEMAQFQTVRKINVQLAKIILITHYILRILKMN